MTNVNKSGFKKSTLCQLIENMPGTQDGIYIMRPDTLEPQTRIASAIHVLQRGCDQTNTSWGVSLGWRDLKNHEHTLLVKNSDLIGVRRQDVLAKLADGGVYISSISTEADQLINYIKTAKAEHAGYLCTSSTVGWAGDSYVLPKHTYGPNTGVIVQYAGPDNDIYTQSGSLDQWQTQVAAKAVGNSRLVFAISVALAGPILCILNLPNIGFHLLSSTSLGKSTALHVAGSVYGPPNKTVAEWLSTTNGLEGTSIARNDGFLALDELGQCADTAIGGAAYLLANGQGKTRQTKDGDNRAPTQWSLSFLSAGEEDLEQKMAKTGLKAKGGQQLRLLSVPGDAGKGSGLFEDLHGFASPALLSDHLKRSTAQFHGTAIHHYLTLLCEPETLANIRSDLPGQITEVISALDLPADLPPDLLRSVKHLAAVALAGELGTAFGVTGWENGVAIAAIKQVLGDWLQSRQNTTVATDDLRLLRQIRQLLEANGSSRFPSLALAANKLGGFGNRLGFSKIVDDAVVEYCVLPEQFDNVFLSGVSNKREAKRMLGQMGWILIEDESHPTRKRSLPTSPNPQRVYVLTTKCLEDDIDC